MSETQKYNLYVNDDEDVTFREWRGKIAGLYDSNMTKLESALSSQDSRIEQNTSFITDLKASTEAIADSLEEHNTSLEDHNNRLSSIQSEMASVSNSIYQANASIESTNSNLVKTDVAVATNTESISKNEVAIAGNATAIANNAKSIKSNTDEIASLNAKIISKANTSMSVECTLSASGWTGSSAPYTQTVAVEGLSASQNGIISISHGAQETTREEARNAMLSVYAQTEGILTVVADGDKPTVDIPVTVIILG